MNKDLFEIEKLKSRVSEAMDWSADCSFKVKFAIHAFDAIFSSASAISTGIRITIDACSENRIIHNCECAERKNKRKNQTEHLQSRFFRFRVRSCLRITVS
jgi:hypothetical protein